MEDKHIATQYRINFDPRREDERNVSNNDVQKLYMKVIQKQFFLQDFLKLQEKY